MSERKLIDIRYADDTIAGFQFEDDARRFLDELRDRHAAFALTLHPKEDWVGVTAGLSTVFRRFLWLLTLIIFLTAPAHAQESARLIVFIHDGEVLFHGAELDLDQLTAQLVATGKQGSRVYLRIGASAKSVYVDRVIKAVREAGFTDIAILGPSGMEKDLDPPV